MSEQAHIRASLALLLMFLTLGLGLEALHGLRDTAWAQDTLRREFLRLGHAHGAILALLNLGLGFAMIRLHTPGGWAGPIRSAAWAGAALVGIGFCGGGLWHGLSDPGPLVLLVPAGALLILTALAAVILLRS